MLYGLLVTFLVLFLIGRFLVWYCSSHVLPPLSKKDKSSAPLDLKFPPGFSFGSATAAWQIEKDVHPSNWTLFERQFRKDGKTPCCPPHRNACDGIAQFDRDLQIMKDMHFTSYRFGLSWSALNPEDGQFDSDYLQHYIEISKKLRDNGIEPMITLWHFEVPAWLEERGGLLSDEFVPKFKSFADWAVRSLKDFCNWWFTINEPAVYPMMGYLFGEFAPGHRSFQEYKKSLINLMKAHVEAYRIIHSYDPTARATIAKQVIPFQPIHSWSGLECLISYLGSAFFNFPVLDSLQTGVLKMSFFGYTVINEPIDGLKDSYDYVSINHYTVIFASINPFDWSGRKECPVLLSNYLSRFDISDFGWTLVPESLALTMQWVNERWNPRKLPMVISEHGISDEKDTKRRPFISLSLAYLQEYIKEKKLPIIKYLHWSLLDNYEWADGYAQHFGLVAVNLETQERTCRPSCEMISRIAANTQSQDQSTFTKDQLTKGEF